MNNILYNKFVQDFSSKLATLVKNREFSHLIFICIGTDRATGDAFGPLVGYKLEKMYENLNKIKIIGNLKEPLCANNAIYYMEKIKREYKDSFIIAIDSAISSKDKIGKIFVEKSSLDIGVGIGKKVLKVGDLSIKAVVSQNVQIPKYNFKILQNVPLGLVMNLADITALGIYNVIQF